MDNASDRPSGHMGAGRSVPYAAATRWSRAVDFVEVDERRGVPLRQGERDLRPLLVRWGSRQPDGQPVSE